jgi:hypothetical protein
MPKCVSITAVIAIVNHTFAGLSLDPVLAAVYLAVRLLFACAENSRVDGFTHS